MTSQPIQLTPSSAALPAPHETPLPAPINLLQQHPLSAALQRQVAQHRTTVADVLAGRDERLLVVVGPCSIHNVDEAFQYADWLAEQAKAYSSSLVIAMRAYIEKPRSTVGWRGLVYDPALDGSQGPDVGLAESRRMMCGVVARGLPVATESLDPFVLPYVQDTLAFTSIGARSCESQTHRQMAATVACPVGLKNATGGCLKVAADAAVAVSSRQSAFSLSSDGHAVMLDTHGNPDVAMVLRGGTNGSNCAPTDLANAHALMQARGVQPAVIVDCSHGNSGKVADRQLDVVDALCAQLKDRGSPCRGVMLESNLRHGQQALVAGAAPKPGVSITDECLDLAQTRDALDRLAVACESRAGRGRGTMAPA